MSDATGPSADADGPRSDGLVTTGDYAPPGDSSELAAQLPAIPGYDVLRLLGRGGMGAVYLARDPRLNRQVAIKVMLAGGLAGPDQLARFRREAEAVARVQHPNIVQIFEVGPGGGLPYLVLEYVDGPTLAQWARGRTIPPPVAVALVERLARAVAAAHSQGVVHRDLKPGNVLLAGTPGGPAGDTGSGDGGPDPTPRLADFGLARHADDAALQTRTGAVLGTPAYMAPEQAEGRNREVGPAADVWALGAILYELLVGRRAFAGADSPAVLRAVVNDAPVPLRKIRPGLARDLETLALKCLEKDPADRYAEAAALADDLRRFRRGEAIAARPLGPGARFLRRLRRHPVAAAMAVAALAAVPVAVLGYDAWRDRQREHIREDIREDVRSDQEELARAIVARERAIIARMRTVKAGDPVEFTDEERTVLNKVNAEMMAGMQAAGARGDRAEEARLRAEQKELQPALAITFAGNRKKDRADMADRRARSASVGNLKRLAVAMKTYHAAHGRLPTDIFAKDGTALLSWRVALLPFLNEPGPGPGFHLDEPWDSKHNEECAKRMPGVFAVSGKGPPGTTYYRRFVGNGKSPAPALEPGRNGGLRLAAITDGESDTLWLVEAKDPVPWTQPGDLVYDPGGPVPELGGLFDDGFHVGLLDGTVVFVPRTEATEPLLRALITRNGGERLAHDWLKQRTRAVSGPAPRK